MPSRSAHTRIPRRRSSATASSTRSRSPGGARPATTGPRGTAERKRAVPPAGTMRPCLAAQTAPRGPSAIPAKHSTPTRSSTASTRPRAAPSSPPAQRAGPVAFAQARPGRRHSTPAATWSKALRTASKALPSLSPSRGRHTSSGHREEAALVLIPTRTPLDRAAAVAASMRPEATTAPGSPVSRSVARELTGQSGTHSAMRLISYRLPQECGEGAGDARPGALGDDAAPPRAGAGGEAALLLTAQRGPAHAQDVDGIEAQ